jgi:hypothetical protein
MAGHFAVYLAYALKAVRYPFELDYGEGIVWQQAMLIPSERMYGDITRFPFLVFHYPPVYHLVVHAVAALGVDVLIAGRSVSLISSLAIGLLAGALAFAAVRGEAGRPASLVGSAVAGLGVFCFAPVVVWSPLMRVDMLAVALSFLGVWWAARSESRPWLLYLAVVAFALALYTKQTCIAAPIATVSVMLWVDCRRTLKACGLGLLLAGAALAVLNWATHGGFLRHILLYNLNRYDLATAARTLVVAVPHLVFVVVAVTAIAEGWRRIAAECGRTGAVLLCEFPRRDRAARLHAILTVYLGVSTAMLATLGKSGSSVNYMVEWMCVLSVLVGTMAARVVHHTLHGDRSEPIKPRSVFPSLLPTLLTVQVLLLPPRADLDVDPAHLREMGLLVARIRDAQRPVLSDDMVLVMKAGREVVWEPAIFAELASTGRWDERRVINKIANRDFAFAITQGQPGTALYDSRYTPGVEQALETAYPRVEQHAGYTVHLPP